MVSEQQTAARAQELLHSFRQVQRSMTSLMRVQADRLGLTPVQMLVLHTLAEESNLSLNDLSERIQLGCSTVSGVVKRLVESGLVERDRLDEDQRTMAIRLTEHGRQLDNLAYGRDSLMSEAFLRFLKFTEEDIDTLLRLHKELIRILSLQ